MGQGLSGGMNTGWNGFEFQAPRYCDDLKDMDFIIGAYDKVVTTHDFGGSINTSTTGTVTTTSNGTSGTVNAIANLAGDGAKAFINGLANKYMAGKTILGKKVTDLISSIPAKGIASVVKGGLNLIFGKTTTTSTSDVKLSTMGTVTLTGTSTTDLTAGIPPLSFNLYGTLNATLNNNDNIVKDTTITTSGHQFGVWTLKETPTVYYERFTVLDFNTLKVSSGGGSMSVSGYTNHPKIKKCDIEPIINPDLLPYVKSYTTTVNYVLCNKIDGQAYKPSTHDIHSVIKGLDTLYCDNDRCLLDIEDTKPIEVSGTADSSCSKERTAFFFDWGTIDKGRVLAVVTLTMKCEYEGVEKEISSSQVFEVKYGIDDSLTNPLYYRFLPSVDIINYGHPYTQCYIYW